MRSVFSPMKLSVRDLARLALLVALDVIFSRVLAINTPLFKIGIGFLAIAMAGHLYGPLVGAGAAALSDLIGAILFPVGAYNPVFTLTAGLMGFVLGFFMHREKVTLRHTVPAALIYSVGLSWLLNSFWIYYFYGATYTAQLQVRLPQCIYLTVVLLVCLPFMPTLRERLKKAGLIK